VKKVICIKRNEFYAHHRKLEIGKTYLLQENISGNLRPDSYYVKSLDGHRLGFYSKQLFMDLEEFRDNQINTILSIWKK